MKDKTFAGILLGIIGGAMGLVGYAIYHDSTTPPYNYDTPLANETARVYPQSKQVLLRQKDQSAYLVNFDKEKICTGVLTYRTSGKTTYEFMTSGACEDFARASSVEKQAIDRATPLLAQGQAKLARHEK